MGGWVEMESHDIGTSIYNEKPLTEDKRDLKIQSLEAAIEGSNNLGLLKMLAMSREGLVETKYRKLLWPRLLGIELHDIIDETKGDVSGSKDQGSADSDVDGTDQNDSNCESKSTLENYKSLPLHSDEEQVKLDVNRSFVYYPNFESEAEKETLRQDLMDCIVYVLRRNPKLAYYQGYHDICQVLLLIFDKHHAMQILEFLSLNYLRDFMMPNMDSSIDHLHLIPGLLQSSDAKLGGLIAHIEPFYAISSILTLFSHDLESFASICLIFDYIFATRCMAVPVYLYASMVISRKPELMLLATEDCDMLHSALAKFPSPISDPALFDVTARASTLLELYPPQHLPYWDSISQYSVLKTTAAPQAPGRRYSSVVPATRREVFSDVCSDDILDETFDEDEEFDEKQSLKLQSPSVLELLDLQLKESTQKALEAQRRRKERAKGPPPSSHPLGLITSTLKITEIFGHHKPASVVLRSLFGKGGKSQALLPRTALGVSIYIGLFSVLVYYYAMDGGGAWLKMTAKLVWQKMVARYFN